MPFQLGTNYTRSQISSAFGLPEDPHAVIRSGGKVKAIVVAKNGRHQCRGARVLQVVEIPNTEYQDVPPHFGILLEDR